MESGYYPPGTEHDPRAPWNAPDAPEIDDDRVIEFVLDEWVGDLIYEGAAEAGSDEDAWFCECMNEEGRAVQSDPMPDLDSAVALFLAERGEEAEAALETRDREEPPEPDEPDYDSMPGGPDEY